MHTHQILHAGVSFIIKEGFFLLHDKAEIVSGGFGPDTPASGLKDDAEGAERFRWHFFSTDVMPKPCSSLPDASAHKMNM